MLQSLCPGLKVHFSTTKFYFKGGNMNFYKKLLTFEGFLLTTIGVIHIIFLGFIIDKSATDATMFWGAIFFGVSYTLLGISFLCQSTKLLFTALGLNIFGITDVLITGKSSPLAAADPFLTFIEIISIFTLFYLNLKNPSL